MQDLFSASPEFTLEALTAAIEELPYVPSRLGSLGLFRDTFSTSNSVQIEYRQGTIYLIPSAPRGGPARMNAPTDRQLRQFGVPHYPLNDILSADEVSGVRAFGSETTLMQFQGLVNDRLEQMKQNHEYTWEYLRALALQGVVKEPDGTSLLDLFTTFNISRTTVTITLATANDIKRGATETIRTIAGVLGMSGLPRVHVMCSDGFFDALIADDEIKDAYDRWQDGQFFRDNQVYSAFQYAGVTWENYRNPLGTDFVTDNEAYAFPVGIPGLFVAGWSPANFVETVNTRAKKLYAKQRPLDWDTGREIHTQSNVIHLCTRPAVLIKVVKA